MNHRPYREIKEPSLRPGLVHALIGGILVALMFFGLLFLWAISEPLREPINDRAPALERAEKAAMSPQKP